MKKKSLIILGSDAGVNNAVSFAFGKDFEICNPRDEQEMLCMIKAKKPSVLMLDLDNVDGGWSILSKVKETWREPIVLIITAYFQTCRQDPRSKEADGFFNKFDGFSPVRRFLVQKGLLLNG